MRNPISLEYERAKCFQNLDIKKRLVRHDDAGADEHANEEDRRREGAKDYLSL